MHLHLWHFHRFLNEEDVTFFTIFPLQECWALCTCLPACFSSMPAANLAYYPAAPLVSAASHLRQLQDCHDLGRQEYYMATWKEANTWVQLSVQLNHNAGLFSASVHKLPPFSIALSLGADMRAIKRGRKSLFIQCATSFWTRWADLDLPNDYSVKCIAVKEWLNLPRMFCMFCILEAYCQNRDEKCELFFVDTYFRSVVRITTSVLTNQNWSIPTSL